MPNQFTFSSAPGYRSGDGESAEEDQADGRLAERRFAVHQLAVRPFVAGPFSEAADLAEEQLAEPRPAEVALRAAREPAAARVGFIQPRRRRSQRRQWKPFDERAPESWARE